MDRPIGEYIKKIRKARKVTLQQMSETTGLSVGYLSLMERGMNNPTVSGLHKVCKALNTTLADLFTNLEENQIFVKKEERKIIIDTPGSIRYEAVTEGKRSINCTSVTIFDNIVHDLGKHISDEHGIVLQGSLSITIEGITYDLKEGDSIYVPAGSRHSFCKTSECDCISIWTSLSDTYKDNDKVKSTLSEYQK
jgi:transcriptional regulator with XRE-family HTH domain